MTCCPECGKGDFEVNEKTDGQGYWWKLEFSCNECGCEWEEETEKTTTKHGTKDDD